MNHICLINLLDENKGERGVPIRIEGWRELQRREKGRKRRENENRLEWGYK